METNTHTQIDKQDAVQLPNKLLNLYITNQSWYESHNTVTIDNVIITAVLYCYRYPARILELKDNEVFIHFDFWSSRYDEWMDMDSDRIRPMVRHSNRTMKTEPNVPQIQPSTISLKQQVLQLYKWLRDVYKIM